MVKGLSTPQKSKNFDNFYQGLKRALIYIGLSDAQKKFFKLPTALGKVIHNLLITPVYNPNAPKAQ